MGQNAAKQSSSEIWKISKVDDTDAEVCAHTRAPLFVFQLGLSRASLEIGERPFPFCDGCQTAITKVKSKKDTYGNRMLDNRICIGKVKHLRSQSLFTGFVWPGFWWRMHAGLQPARRRMGLMSSLFNVRQNYQLRV